MAEDNRTVFSPKRSYESAFPQYGSEAGPITHEEDEESSYWKRPRYVEGAGLASGDEGSSDEATAPMGSYDREAYDTPPSTAIEYTEGDSAYQATQNLDPHHYNYTTHNSSSDDSPCSPADETWNWRSSHDATLTELCQKFSGSESFQIDPDAPSSSGSQSANSGLNYSYGSVAPQYYRADSGYYVPSGTENEAHVAGHEHVNESNTAGMYASNQVSAWSYYDPSVAGPSTYQGYAGPQTFDDLELLTAVSSPPPITYFSDPSSSSLYYFDHHPPDSNSASVAPYAYHKDEAATPDLSEVTSVSQADGMDMFTQEEPMNSVSGIIPGSMESFIFNTSTMEQFDGNANVESARERVGLGSDSVLPGMKATLMPHQITGVAWMLDKEDKDKGGCLGDEMGLGKTVQMIAVLVKNRSNDNSKKTTLIITPTSLLDQWRQELEIKTDCGLSCLIYHGSKRNRHANDLLQYDVVLTSYNTMSNEWPEADDSNSAERTTGRRRRSEAGPLFRLEFYRIVLDEAQSIRNKWTLTSRAVCDLKAVYRWCLTGTPIINTLMDVYGYLRFLRIEPWCDIHEFRSRIGEHEKKNPNLAAKRLQAILKSFLLRRKKDSTLDGKRLIELPEKTVDLVKLEFSPEEREIYNMVEARTQAKFNRFLRAGTVLKNYHQVLVLLLRLRQICSHPSLIQEEGMDSAEANGLSIDPVKEQTRAASLISPQFVEKVKRKFLEIHETRVQLEKESSRDAEVEDEECPICFDTLTDSVITACSHVFCRECIVEAIDHSRVPDSSDGGNKYSQGEKPCPVCRAAISKDKLFNCAAFEPPDESDHTKRGSNHTETPDKDAVESKIDAWTNPHCPPPSSKMKFMMQQLQKLMSEHPEEKVLIVSQWTSCLSLVSNYLQEASISHVNYRGDMDRTQRTQAVKDFTCNPDISVMLMSLKCGGVGLNLTRANHVISLDLGWSQAVEAQAFDRVHRLGQNRAVSVKRLAIANTVEDRVLQMQERKQALTDGSLGEGTGKKIKFSIRELANLFGLDQYGHVLENNYT